MSRLNIKSTKNAFLKELKSLEAFVQQTETPKERHFYVAQQYTLISLAKLRALEQRWLNNTKNKLNIQESATAYLNYKTDEELLKEFHNTNRRKAQKKKAKSKGKPTQTPSPFKKASKAYDKVEAKKARIAEMKVNGGGLDAVLKRKLDREARKAQSLSSLFS